MSFAGQNGWYDGLPDPYQAIFEPRPSNIAGLNRMIDSFIPKNMKWGMILCIISISILLLDDGKISELNSSIAKDIAATDWCNRYPSEWR